MYTVPRFKTKQQLIDAVASSQDIRCDDPWFARHRTSAPINGTGCVVQNGYVANVVLNDGKIVEVK